MRLGLTASLLASAAAMALPEPAITLRSITTPTPSAILCSAVNLAVTALQEQAAATSYCSSYLSITTSTVTGTSTVAVFPPNYSCYASSGSAGKRDAAPAVPLAERNAAIGPPPAFASYTASAALSSACSCLHIPTPTTTVSATATVTEFVIRAGYNQQYATATNDGLAFTVPSASAQPFQLSTDTTETCALTGPGARGQAYESAGHDLVAFDEGGYDYFKSEGEPVAQVSCSIQSGTNALVCAANNGGDSTEVSNVWYLGSGAEGSSTGTLTAVPIA